MLIVNGFQASVLMLRQRWLRVAPGSKFFKTGEKEYDAKTI
jgi:hypothetical protein